MLALALSLLALPLGASPHAAGPALAAHPRAGLSLRLLDPQDLLPAGTDAVASELARLFADIGVPVRLGEDDEPAPPGYPLRVVLLPSRPSGPGWRLPPRALGVTLSDGVRSAPAVYVFYPQLLRIFGVRQTRNRLPSTRDLRLLTRALARVVAHEVFHALLPGQPHAASGLMQAALTPEFLVGEEVAVDDRWARLLLRRLDARAPRERSEPRSELDRATQRSGAQKR